MSEKLTQPWMYALKLCKMLSFFLFLSILANIVMAYGYSYLFPLKEKIPVVVEFSTSDNNFVVVQSGKENITSNFLLVRMFLKEYVVNREKVDKITEDQRYLKIYTMSAGRVFDDFKKVYGNPETGLFYVDKFKRSIMIISDSRIARDIHQIEFNTIDKYDDERKATVSEWVTTLRYKFVKQKVSYEKAELNPLGLLITEYSTTKRK